MKKVKVVISRLKAAGWSFKGFQKGFYNFTKKSFPVSFSEGAMLMGSYRNVL